MQVLYPFNENFRAFKTCRLCGSNNQENIDIFTSKPISSKAEDLLTKILSVYPLVLYKDDPLPQHICPKCIGNVSTTYQGIQQVLKQQSKWLKLAKAAEPEHEYFRILNAVEISTQATKASIKTSYNVAINNMPLGKFLASTAREHENANQPIKSANTEDINEAVVKNIQNKLVSNGFTIKRIKVASAIYANQDLNPVTDSLDASGDFVTCKHCNKNFPSLKILAQHQLIHLQLSTNKIFEKHLLPKNMRRGRLITLNDNKCIRCLNCWRIHKDNKAILQHWAEGECEFYCLVCGNEYPHSPKMLRDHIAEAHGVSYRSIKTECMAIQTPDMRPILFAETMHDAATDHLNTAVSKKINKRPPKSCTKNEDGTIACKICHKVFDNFRSSNSHMRVHKPQNRIVVARLATDKYGTEDDYDIHPSTSKSYYNHATVTNLMNVKSHKPFHKVIVTNGDMKTKIVQEHHDFLSNHTAHNRHPMDRSPNISDNENLIVPELLTPAMKLQHEKSCNGLQSAEYGSDITLTPTIKSEPLDDTEFQVSDQARFCFICNESFSTSRDYELHAMFVHNLN